MAEKAGKRIVGGPLNTSAVGDRFLNFWKRGGEGAKAECMEDNVVKAARVASPSLSRKDGGTCLEASFLVLPEKKGANTRGGRGRF